VRVLRPRAWVERHLALAGFAAFALVSGLVRVADYAKPLSSDPAQFLYVGETIGQGGMPYADAAFSKGPLTGLLFAAVDPLVGTSASAVRLTVVPFAALAALALAGYVAHHAGRAAGLVAGLMCAALSGIEAFEGAEAKTEQYGIAPMFGALWLATRGGGAATAGAGALASCAILIHPAFVVLALAVAAELWLGAARGARARRLLLAAAGGLAPAAVAVAWLAAGGALDDALTQIGEQIRSSTSESVVQPLDQVRQGSGDGGGSIALPALRDELPAWLLWAMAFAACGAAAREPRLRRPAVVIALALGAVLLRVKLASYELDYQYYPAVPAMAGAIALATASLWRGRSRVWIAVAAVVLAVPLAGYVIRPQARLLREDPAARLESAARAVPVADFVRDHTAPGEPIFVVGGRAEVYWRAERRAPTRFFDVHGLTSADDVAERDRGLARTLPAAVAVVGPDRLSDDPGLERLVRERGYELGFDEAGSRVWTRTSVHQ
jgi:hypothetical protein